MDRIVTARLHQPAFRARVMSAYQGACAVCSLRHVELLDAAHIISDADDMGDPIVPNGLSLCKIHHAAYDRRLLGIAPDRTVHVNAQLLAERDGPMLRHGLQAMHGRQIEVPRRRANRPDPDRLQARFTDFLAG